MNYSIDARPTPELYFTAESGEQFCINMDGEISAAPDEDLSDLRSAPTSATNVNEDVKSALQMARDHAADNGWVLSDYMYFN